MRNGFDELLLLAEEDIKWLDDAAQRFEELASQVDEPRKSDWDSHAAAYRERAEMHVAVVENLRHTKRPAKSNILNRLIGGLGAPW